MKFLRLIGVAGAVLFAAAQADAATLRPQVVVEGDTVRLSDIFDDAGARANSTVVPAPSPGRRATYDVQWLAEVARIFQVSWRPTSRFDRIVIERAGRTVPARELVARLTPALRERGMGARSEIELQSRAQDIALPLDATDAIEIRQLDYDQTGGRFTAVMIVGAGHALAQRVIVAGRIHPTLDVPVPRRAIGPGEILRPQDLEWTSMREDRVRRDIVTDPNRLLGTTPRSRLRQGEPVREGDTRPPVLVARNAQVAIILEHGPMRLTVLGRATEEGARGETIRVTNLQSRTLIEAVVTGPDTVTVQIAPRLLANTAN
jgi:flagellar basal body P-ring formation protein FlgA